MNIQEDEAEFTRLIHRQIAAVTEDMLHDRWNTPPLDEVLAPLGWEVIHTPPAVNGSRIFAARSPSGNLITVGISLTEDQK
jgi:hypothetical protein